MGKETLHEGARKVIRRLQEVFDPTKMAKLSRQIESHLDGRLKMHGKESLFLDWSGNDSLNDFMKCFGEAVLLGDTPGEIKAPDGGLLLSGLIEQQCTEAIRRTVGVTPRDQTHAQQLLFHEALAPFSFRRELINIWIE